MNRSYTTLFFCSAIALLCAAPQQVLGAQDAPSNSVSSTIIRARGQLDGGQANAARNTMDSLVAALAPGSIDLVEALYWRAAMAERLPDAERDWKRLLIESPLSSRAADALLRLSELEALRGQHEGSRQHAERLVLDHSQSALRPRAQLLVAKSWFAQNNTANGCSALTAMRSPDLVGETKLQSDELMSHCSPSVTATTARSPSTAPAPANAKRADNATNSSSSSQGRYSVQLAAYARKSDADAMVNRLQEMNIAARVDGTAAPFRVRTGYYETRAAATAALEAFTKRGMKGFVAEIQQ